MSTGRNDPILSMLALALTLSSIRSGKSPREAVEEFLGGPIPDCNDPNCPAHARGETIPPDGGFKATVDFDQIRRNAERLTASGNLTDVPLVSDKPFAKLVPAYKGNTVALLTRHVDEAGPYCRLTMDDADQLGGDFTFDLRGYPTIEARDEFFDACDTKVVGQIMDQMDPIVTAAILGSGS